MANWSKDSSPGRVTPERVWCLPRSTSFPPTGRLAPFIPDADHRSAMDELGNHPRSKREARTETGTCNYSRGMKSDPFATHYLLAIARQGAISRRRVARAVQPVW